MDLPVADIHDSKEHLRFRAVCDERITLPLKAFSDLPEIYNNLSAFRGQQAVVEVKMAWRCNTEQWWTARLRPECAAPSTAWATPRASSRGSALALKGSSLTPRRRSRSGPCHITPDNVSSVASDDYKRKVAAHVGRAWNAVWC